MKTNKFDFNQKKMSVFQKFIGFLNEITDEVKEIETLADTDETESGEVSLKYEVSDSNFIEVKADGLAYDNNGNALEDGEYPLVDGSVLVVKDGKFNGTIVKEEATAPEAEEAPIAQEETPTAEEETTEEETEETEEVVEETEEEATEEETTEEETTEEEEVAEETELVPFMIGDVEYMLPQEVVDYINSLSATSETFRKEIAQIKQRTPSTKPTTTAPIKQSKEEEKGNLYNRVNMFRK